MQVLSVEDLCARCVDAEGRERFEVIVVTRGGEETPCTQPTSVVILRSRGERAVGRTHRRLAVPVAKRTLRRTQVMIERVFAGALRRPAMGRGGIAQVFTPHVITLLQGDLGQPLERPSDPRVGVGGTGVELAGAFEISDGALEVVQPESRPPQPHERGVGGPFRAVARSECLQRLGVEPLGQELFRSALSRRYRCDQEDEEDETHQAFLSMKRFSRRPSPSISPTTTFPGRMVDTPAGVPRATRSPTLSGT